MTKGEEPMSAPNTNATNDPLIGHNLGAYKVLERLGGGGMATIYVGYQESMQRKVAIKVMRSDMASMDPTFVARFEREARTIAALEHTRILPVYDYGYAGDSPYLVMRLLQSNLQQRLQQQPLLDLTEVNRILGQIAAALDFAHRHGVVHRDLKPANILLDDQLDCFLADFGIVHLLGSGPALTTPGEILGTPAYMAPEQCERGQATAATDIYALGVILYEMVCGLPPFDGENLVSVLRQHIDETPELDPTCRPHLPAACRQVILDALAKDPAQRPASAQAIAERFAHGLRELAHDETGVGRAVGTAEQQPPAHIEDEPTIVALDDEPTVQVGAGGEISARAEAPTQTDDAQPATTPAAAPATRPGTDEEAATLSPTLADEPSAGPRTWSGRAVAALVVVLVFAAALAGLAAAAGMFSTGDESDPAVSNSDQRSADDLNQAGLEALAALDYDAAIDQFQAAIALDPSLAGAHFNLGVAYEELGDLQAAQAAYEQALEQDDQLLIARYRLANLLLDDGQLDGGFRVVDVGLRMLQRGPLDLDEAAQDRLSFLLLTTRGRAYYLLGSATDLALAEADLRQALTFKASVPFPAEAYYVLALVYDALEQPDAAYQAWLDVLATHDTSNPRHRQWAAEARAVIED